MAQFGFFQHLNQPLGPRTMWLLNFPEDPVADLPFDPILKGTYAFNAGFTRFHDYGDDPANEPGLYGPDRVGYKGAYCFWQHTDPGSHKYVHALRIHVQNHGLSAVSLINDNGMHESPFNIAGESQGLLPYAYETDLAWATLPIDKRHPGGVIEVFHHRGGGTRQLLQRFVVPVRDAGGMVSWYYQDRGRFIAVDDQMGVAAKLVVSAIHPAYGFRVQGVPTKNADTLN